MRDVTVMLGFKSSGKVEGVSSSEKNADVAKLFYDTFSNRVGGTERELRRISGEFESLKASVERGQISDLVLLERLQKTEVLIRDTLSSLKTAVESAVAIVSERSEYQVPIKSAVEEPVNVSESRSAEIGIVSHILSPTGQLGSLPSITTPTELQVLTLLADEGPKSAPEIGKVVGRSREHTARLMKRLYEEGYVRRDQTRIPFRYSVVDRLKQSMAKPEVRDEEKEPISIPQT